MRKPGNAKGDGEMERGFTVLIEEGEDGYFIAGVVELPGCHTQAKSLGELMERVKEAISLYPEAGKDVKFPRFVGILKIS